MTEKPTKSQIKLGWVSTWNTKCGIADYSRSLINSLPYGLFDITVFANFDQPLSPEPTGVERSWHLMDSDIGGIARVAIARKFDVVVFQINFGFFDFKVLGESVVELESNGIETYLFFHKTENASEGRNLSIGDVAHHLTHATRLVVHTVDDVNRLKSFGLVDNVVRLPQGVPDSRNFEPDLARRFLGLNDAGPIIAAYGFLLPHKGIAELILTFGLLRATHPHAKLLLLNGEYPSPISTEEASRCRALISDLGLESDVIFVTDYLDNEDVLLLLQAADVIVYAYQVTGESSSAAVRVGLAAQRPVAVTPLTIFDEVKDLTYRLPGTGSAEMASGLNAFLSNAELREALAERQRNWLDETRWQRVGQRFGDMMIGIHEERHAVSLVQVRQTERGDRLVEGVAVKHGFEVLKPEALVKLACQRAFGHMADPRMREWITALENGSMSQAEFFRLLATESEEIDAADEGTRILSIPDLDQKDDKEFVKELYNRILLRPAEDEGLDFHLDQLRRGVSTRASLIDSFLGCDEFLSRDEIVTIRRSGRLASAQ